MESIFSDILFGFLGWVYVLIRFRNLTKAKAFVEENYNGSYSAAGGDMMLSAIAMLGAAFLSIFVIYIIIVFIYKLITGTLSSS
ncbi:hypothetical protein [Fulvivirga lutea]|uniref:Uncharacterized protein n=1 Tax=Fulvivirga lutea TaxID=2810512 RepID=A0A974WHD1_9BACT|nr:hypothetical protein [Fulvivirga lutea]QSE98564.1 hypothetical protein JR347_05645 [Fulvivirga lutea]